MTTVANKLGVDPTLPNVPIILGGVERHLAFDYNAICLAEQTTGINLLRAMVSDVNATSLRGLLWAALIRESPELKIDQVGSWINPKNAPGIYQCLLLAWYGSIPEPEAEAVKQGEEQAQAATPTA